MSLSSPPRFRFTLPSEGGVVDRTQAADEGVLSRRTRGTRRSNSPSESDDNCVSLSEVQFRKHSAEALPSRPPCGLAGGRPSGSGTSIFLEEVFGRVSDDAAAGAAAELSLSGCCTKSRRSSSSSLESSPPPGKDGACLCAHASAGPSGTRLLPVTFALTIGTEQTSLPRRIRQILPGGKPAGWGTAPAARSQSRGADAGWCSRSATFLLRLYCLPFPMTPCAKCVSGMCTHSDAF